MATFSFEKRVELITKAVNSIKGRGYTYKKVSDMTFYIYQGSLSYVKLKVFQNEVDEWYDDFLKYKLQQLLPVECFKTRYMREIPDEQNQDEFNQDESKEKTTVQNEQKQGEVNNGNIEEIAGDTITGDKTGYSEGEIEIIPTGGDGEQPTKRKRGRPKKEKDSDNGD